jgi:hypothetical protein
VSLRLGGAAFALVALLGACADRGTPEERVRALVGDAARAASAKDLGGLLALVSPDYADPHGNRRDDVKRILAFHVLRAGSVHAFAAAREVAVDEPTRARAVVLAALARVPIHDLTDLAALDADLFRFDLSLALEDGGWRVTSATWGPASAEDFLPLPSPVP